jgi:hypothetical protein
MIKTKGYKTKVTLDGVIKEEVEELDESENAEETI